MDIVPKLVALKQQLKPVLFKSYNYMALRASEWMVVIVISTKYSDGGVTVAGGIVLLPTISSGGGV